MLLLRLASENIEAIPDTRAFCSALPSLTSTHHSPLDLPEKTAYTGLQEVLATAFEGEFCLPIWTGKPNQREQADPGIPENCHNS